MMDDGWLSALQVPAELRYGSTEEPLLKVLIYLFVLLRSSTKNRV
jgi:hypothetical protein